MQRLQEPEFQEWIWLSVTGERLIQVKREIIWQDYDDGKPKFTDTDGKKYGYVEKYKTAVLEGKAPYIVTIEGEEVVETSKTTPSDAGAQESKDNKESEEKRKKADEEAKRLKEIKKAEELRKQKETMKAAGRIEKADEVKKQTEVAKAEKVKNQTKAQEESKESKETEETKNIRETSGENTNNSLSGGSE